MFDRSFTVWLLNAGDAVALRNLGLPGGQPKLELSVWGGGAWIDAFLFEGVVSDADVSGRFSASGSVDCLLAVPLGGVAKRYFDPDIRALTVYARDSTPTFVGVRIREVP